MWFPIGYLWRGNILLAFCQLESSEFYHFHARKCIWKCRLLKWRTNFVQGGDAVSGILDQFPCVANFKIPNSKHMKPKYASTWTISDKVFVILGTDLLKTNISSPFNSDLMVDSNFECYGAIRTFPQKHFLLNFEILYITVNAFDPLKIILHEEICQISECYSKTLKHIWNKKLTKSYFHRWRQIYIWAPSQCQDGFPDMGISIIDDRKTVLS